jgi:ankyrin repeat protein
LIFKLLELLIRHGADPSELDSLGMSPLINALSSRNYAVVGKMMEERLPQLSSVDKDDRNILHIMCSNGSLFDPEGLKLFRSILS